MKRIVSISYVLSVILLAACVRQEDPVVGQKMTFVLSDASTKAFIDDVNRSGNELVVHDYATIIDRTYPDCGESHWHIYHSRIRCTVDGQEIWDFVNGDEYYWLYGTHHKSFGWLYIGPSGFNTVTFFGSHPEFDADTHTLPLPAYNFTLESPVYDFLYSDIESRDYTRLNPDSSPINLHMNHMFSAFRFSVRNMRNNSVKLQNATLTVMTKKAATLNYKDENDGVSISYSDVEAGNMSQALSNELGSEGSCLIFNQGVSDGYHLIWPQSKEEFKTAVLTLKYIDEENQVKTEAINLNKGMYDEWIAGKRYNYDVVFTDKEIKLICNVEPWDKQSLVLDYTNVVVVSEKIKWDESSVLSLDEHTGEVVLKPNIEATAECTFTINAPKGGQWTASLMYTEGDAGSFVFVDPEDNTKVIESQSGEVGTEARLRIRVKKEGLSNRIKAKLRIIVKVGNRTIVVENLCPGHEYHEYTLIQNVN